MNKKIEYKFYDTKICQCFLMNPYFKEYREHMDKYHPFTGEINNDINLTKNEMEEEIK